jgi:hypothetical protein
MTIFEKQLINNIKECKNILSEYYKINTEIQAEDCINNLRDILCSEKLNTLIKYIEERT